MPSKRASILLTFVSETLLDSVASEGATLSCSTYADGWGGVCVDRYLDGVTTVALNDIKCSGVAGAVGADPVMAHYYSSADSIDVVINSTGSTGAFKVLAWVTSLND